MSSSDILSSRLATPHVFLGKCPRCSTPLEYLPPAGSSSSAQSYRIRCFSCGSVIPHSPSEEQARPQATATPDPGPQPSASAKRTGRKIGTDERPLETGYYDLLGVPVNATSDEIKKAYRRLAIKNHPDKGGSEELFKEIAIAYQVLSDPALRHKYNEFGPKEGAASPEGGFVDPEEIFSSIFGGERFVAIIGDISLGKEMKSALQEADEAEEAEGTGPKRVKDAKGKDILSPEEKAKKEEKDRKAAAERAAAREARVSKLVENLERKLSIYTESATGVAASDVDVMRSWKQICAIEAEDLKNESYGVELLHAVGSTYVAKARQYIAQRDTFLGVGGFFHGIKGSYHTFTETVSTVRAALDLKQTFEQLAAAEKSGASPEEKRRLEEQAAEKGLQALFKGTKLEIDSVIRETCDRVLSPTPPPKPTTTSNGSASTSAQNQVAIPPQKLALRAIALEALGEAYLKVKKDVDGTLPGQDESEYVRVDTKASKERDGKRASGGWGRS
ncbi:DnaJ-domain-containing protein [Clavulina sp. PMI_390]|nr:DnaJ-domain-containing protein [Clavulina sp. PMI_390]